MLLCFLSLSSLRSCKRERGRRCNSPSHPSNDCHLSPGACLKCENKEHCGYVPLSASCSPKTSLTIAENTSGLSTSTWSTHMSRYRRSRTAHSLSWPSTQQIARIRCTVLGGKRGGGLAVMGMLKARAQRTRSLLIHAALSDFAPSCVSSAPSGSVEAWVDRKRVQPARLI